VNLPTRAKGSLHLSSPDVPAELIAKRLVVDRQATSSDGHCQPAPTPFWFWFGDARGADPIPRAPRALPAAKQRGLCQLPLIWLCMCI
jgi:hypothetical protein